MSTGAPPAIATRAVATHNVPKPVSSAFDMKGALSWYEAVFVEYILPPAFTDLHRQVAGEAVSHAPRGRVLDVGCGAGSAAMQASAQAPEAVIVGVDLCEKMLRYAERKLQRAGVKNVSLQLGDATDLPFEAAQFDAVYSIASLKMWPDPEAGLREIHRVLRPGGQMVLAEIDRGATDDALREYCRRFRLIPTAVSAIYVRSYVLAQSPDLVEADAMMRRSPFGRVDVSRMPHYPFFIVRAQKT